jgi:hypothetical protein
MVMTTQNPLPASQSVLLTEDSLCRWVGTAAPGDIIIYFRGSLARSLCPELELLPVHERARLGRLAARARKLAEAGLAHLVQRRHGVEDCSYILVAACRPQRVVSDVLTRLLAEAA